MFTAETSTIALNTSGQPHICNRQQKKTIAYSLNKSGQPHITDNRKKQ